MTIQSPLVEMELRPFVEEAVIALGYFAPSIAEWMIVKMKAAEARGADLERVIDDDWREHLTPKGKECPLHAVTTTYRRARRAARDHAQRARTMPLLTRDPPIFPAVVFSEAIQDPCAAAHAIDRSLHRLPPALPLPGCDREVCGCSWRAVSKPELERR